MDEKNEIPPMSGNEDVETTGTELEKPSHPPLWIFITVGVLIVLLVALIIIILVLQNT